MKFTASILLASILSTATAASTHKEYYLKSEVKPGQEACKDRFSNLYIQGYHSGAGMGDATLSTKSTKDASKFYLVPTKHKLSNGRTSNLAQFDYGTSFAWTFVEDEGANLYGQWEPVRINAGNGSASNMETSGFFVDHDGLEWENSVGATNAIFGGWIACDWWHSVPQLFFRIGYYNATLPCSCADIKLIPTKV